MSSEMCPALIIGDEVYNTPPIACRRGLTPELDEGVIYADSRCDIVAAQLANEHCEKIGDGPIKSGQATPGLLAQKRWR